MKRPPPDSTLREASAHVLYEIEQFTNAYTLLVNADWWASLSVPTFMAQTAHNALVESFTLHVRSLSAFFHDHPRHDDMWAGDWFAPDEWESIRAAEPLVELRKTRGRVNKEIAHLTYARLKVPFPVWPHQEVVHRLSSDIFKFLDHVDPSRVVDGFKIRAWSSLPVAHDHPAPIVRGDSSSVRPIATSGFGVG